MKTIKFIRCTAVVVAVLILAACEDNMPGYYHEKEYELDDFTGVSFGDALQVKIIQAEEFKVTAKGEDQDLIDLELRVENKMLTGNYRRSGKNRKRTLVEVYLPDLKKAHMHSATTTTIRGFNSEEDSLELTASAASVVSMESSWKYLEVETGGASEVTLTGQVSQVKAGVSGNSELKALGLESDHYYIEVNGSSKARVNVLEVLKGEVNGKSELSYAGNPSTVEVQVEGDSKLNPEQ